MTVEERESVEELRARRVQVQRDIDFNKRMLEGSVWREWWKV